MFARRGISLEDLALSTHDSLDRQWSESFRSGSDHVESTDRSSLFLTDIVSCWSTEINIVDLRALPSRIRSTDPFVDWESKEQLNHTQKNTEIYVENTRMEKNHGGNVGDSLEEGSCLQTLLTLSKLATQLLATVWIPLFVWSNIQIRAPRRQWLGRVFVGC